MTFQRLLGVLALLTAVVVLSTVILRAPANAQGEWWSFDLQDDLTDPIPPPCTVWHELYPQESNLWHQTDYIDANGDGEISECDVIIMGDPTGITWEFHICWVGPTYFLSRPAGDSRLILEPRSVDPQRLGTNPICENWEPIPGGPGYHVDGWEDNGDGVVSPCDMIHFEGEDPSIWWHLDDIGLDILVSEPGGPSPTEESTWGWIKSLFKW